MLEGLVDGTWVFDKRTHTSTNGFLPFAASVSAVLYCVFQLLVAFFIAFCRTTECFVLVVVMPRLIEFISYYRSSNFLLPFIEQIRWIICAISSKNNRFLGWFMWQKCWNSQLKTDIVECLESVDRCLQIGIRRGKKVENGESVMVMW